MADSISAGYLISLTLFAGLLSITFYGFSRRLAGVLPIFNNLAGGFVSWLAVNELLALPFIFAHWSFHLYFPLFLLLNAGFFVYGLRELLIGRWTIWRGARANLSLAALAAILVIGLSAYLPQFIVKYDADDAYYVSLVQQSQDNSRLYADDPATGSTESLIATYHRSQDYHKFEGWELIKAGLAKLFGLSALEISHGLAPLVMIPLAFLAHRQLFSSAFTKRWQVNAGLFFLGLLFLFGGYARNSQGTFLLTRSWQGKVMLATLIIPLLFYAWLKLRQQISQNRTYLAFSVLSLAALALNPASIFVVGAALVILAVMLVIERRPWITIMKLAAAGLPLLAAGLAIAIFKYIHGSQFANSSEVASDFTWASTLSGFVGNSWYFYILAVGAAGLLFFKTTSRLKNYNRQLLIFTGLLFLLIINPLLFEPLTKLARTTYWRLYWLIPLTALLPVIAVAAADVFAAKLRQLPGWLGRTAGCLLVGAFLILAGSWYYVGQNHLFAHDNTRRKLPPSVAGILDFMAGQPALKTVAAKDVAAYYHTGPAPQALFISRTVYWRAYCGGSQSAACSQQLSLYLAANGIIDERLRPKLKELLDKYQIGFFIVNNRVYDKKLEPADYQKLFRNQRYTVLKVN